MNRKAAEDTIFIVDDDEVVRESISFLMDSVDLPCKTFHSARDFLDEFDGSTSGCLVLDVRMADMSGLDLQESLNERGSTMPIIFATGHGDVPMAVNALHAGAFDFLEKPFRDQDLLDRVNSALQQNRSQRERLDEIATVHDRYKTLTKREKEVMAHMVTGKPTKVIARDLKVSPRTIELHRRRVLNKMETKSIAELVEMNLMLQE